MKIKNVLLFGIGILVLISCNQTSEKELTRVSEDTANTWADTIVCSQDWNRYANDFIAICYPENWESDASGLMGAELVLKFEAGDTLLDGRLIRPNLNIMKQPSNQLLELGITNLDEFAAFNKEQLVNYLEDCKIESFEQLSLSGLDAYHIVLKATQMETLMHFDMYMVKKNKYYFAITFTVNAEHVNESRDIANEIIQTLRFS